MNISFTIMGEPTGKGRPKFSRQGNFVKAYTPEKTEKYEHWVKLSYIEKYGNKKSFADDAPLYVYIDAYYNIPKSVSKKKAAMMMRGDILPTKKPDCDNIIKIILDALNGLAYKDDQQVAKVSVAKRYVYSTDSDARVEVYISD